MLDCHVAELLDPGVKCRAADGGLAREHGRGAQIAGFQEVDLTTVKRGVGGR